MAWFASAVHTTFAHIIRPERFATDSAVHRNLKDTARGVFWEKLQGDKRELCLMAMGGSCARTTRYVIRMSCSHQTADARACCIHRVFQKNAGPLRGIQGPPVRGGYIEGRKCVAWPILRSAPTHYCQFVMLPPMGHERHFGQHWRCRFAPDSGSSCGHARPMLTATTGTSAIFIQ